MTTLIHELTVSSVARVPCHDRYPVCTGGRSGRETMQHESEAMLPVPVSENEVSEIE
jgi:hypothetical protein